MDGFWGSECVKCPVGNCCQFADAGYCWELMTTKRVLTNEQAALFLL